MGNKSDALTLQKEYCVAIATKIFKLQEDIMNFTNKQICTAAGNISSRASGMPYPLSPQAVRDKIGKGKCKFTVEKPNKGHDLCWESKPQWLHWLQQNYPTKAFSANMPR